MKPVEEEGETYLKRSFIMSHEWSTNRELVRDLEKEQILEEDVRFNEDPLAGCRAIFYGALFSGFVLVFLSLIIILRWWIG
jgi:hypothetical protein